MSTKKAKEKRTARVLAYVEPSISAKLETYAEKRGITISNAVRNLLADALKVSGRSAGRL